MSNRWFYRYAGQTISSALELPEWAPFSVAAESAAPTMRFELNAPAPLSDDDDQFRVQGAICRFAVPAIALYEISAGQTIAVTPALGADELEIRLFLLGSAWGIIQYQRANFALHAGVIRVGSSSDGSSHGDVQGDGCVAFCGASGAGKSSSVAYLVEQGYQLWSDDLSVCQLEEGAPAVWPATRRLKLWRASLDALGHDAQGLRRDYFREEKFYLELGTPNSLAHAEPLPLRAIYLLEWGEPECVRLRGLEALNAFVEAATYRGMVLNDMGAAPEYWRQCAQIVRAVPVFRLRRPRDWARLPDALRPVLEYWKP